MEIRIVQQNLDSLETKTKRLGILNLERARDKAVTAKDQSEIDRLDSEIQLAEKRIDKGKL